MSRTARVLKGKNIGWWAAVAVLSGLLVYLLFGHLGEFFITDYDEARHGANAYEMIRNNDYLVSTYQGETDYWNLKPPLSFWLITLAYRLFGYNAFALRFFSALATLLSAAALCVWGSRRFGRWAAVFILFVFVANLNLYGEHFSRFGDADAQYQLFFTLSMLCMLLSEKDFRWFYGSGLFFGLAFLEKGFHAANIPLICFATLLGTGRLKELTVKRVGLLLLSALALTAPWAIARYSRDGWAFFTKMFSTDVVHRVGSIADPADANLPALAYYLVKLVHSPAMVVCLLLCAVSFAAIRFHRAKLPLPVRNTVIGCALWLALPYAFYSIANVRYVWYVYSMFFAIPALSCALLFYAVSLGGFRKIWLVCACVTALVFSGFAAYSAVSIAKLTFDDTVQGFLKETLDRSGDEGRHAYILYSENQLQDWMPADLLTAELYGDTDCRSGGVDAFLNDEDSAVLFVCKVNHEDVVEQLQAEEVVRNEGYYVIAFEN